MYILGAEVHIFIHCLTPHMQCVYNFNMPTATHITQRIVIMILMLLMLTVLIRTNDTTSNTYL